MDVSFEEESEALYHVLFFLVLLLIEIDTRRFRTRGGDFSET